jgi:hypothetical protein
MEIHGAVLSLCPKIAFPVSGARKQYISLRGKMSADRTPLVITYTVLSLSKWQHIDPQWIAVDSAATQFCGH